MSNDDTSSDGQSRVTPLTTTANSAVVRSKPQSWFALPAPVKRVFDLFPLREYERNALPTRAPGEKQREGNALHVFGREEDVRAGRPSFNPGCLKWQVRRSHILSEGLRALKMERLGGEIEADDSIAIRNRHISVSETYNSHSFPRTTTLLLLARCPSSSLRVRAAQAIRKHPIPFQRTNSRNGSRTHKTQLLPLNPTTFVSKPINLSSTTEYEKPGCINYTLHQKTTL